MNKIIKFNEFEASINSKGAYVEYLKNDDNDIFFKKKEISIGDTKKPRGGSHVCLPFFGSNDKFDLPRHGFGRDVSWDVESESDFSVKYRLSPTNKDFEKMISTLEYSLFDNKFKSILTVKNIGESNIEISPAFHPYFSYENLENVKINGEKLDYSEKELEDSVFFDKVRVLETDKFKIKLEDTNLSKFVIWSDFRDKYICVEPTYNYEGAINGGAFVLRSGETANFEYVLDITVL